MFFWALCSTPKVTFAPLVEATLQSSTLGLQLYHTTHRIRIASANHEIYMSENGPSCGAAAPTPVDP
ncbi:unnamed protein product [Ectocarpus sp. CCAP 1310/34]|nr:unnamed protein product [Ectocarpus sp. CCAP 1310/34]